jgi:hypothetical protein
MRQVTLLGRAANLLWHNYRMSVPSWSEKADALIRVTHPDFAALKLRVPLESILARRDELKLPPVAEQFPKWGSRTRQPKGA